MSWNLCIEISDPSHHLPSLWQPTGPTGTRPGRSFQPQPSSRPVPASQALTSKATGPKKARQPGLRWEKTSVRMPIGHQLLQLLFVDTSLQSLYMTCALTMGSEASLDALGLAVWSTVTTNVGALVPSDATPFQTLQQTLISHYLTISAVPCHQWNPHQTKVMTRYDSVWLNCKLIH